MKFYQCAHCKNIIVYAYDKGVPVSCCGEKMKELIPNTAEAATEKHLPVITKNENGIVEITVGSTLHPMLSEHHIGWVVIETKEGAQKKTLSGEPRITFTLSENDKLIAAYAYCNLHGLWKTEA